MAHARRSGLGRAHSAALIANAWSARFEVYLLTSMPLTEHFAATVSPLAGVPVVAIGLRLDRGAASASRVASMRSSRPVSSTRRTCFAGLPAEAHALSGLVYRQVLEFPAVRGERETRELIVRENMRYARRQLIWFRKEPGVTWIDGAGERSDVQAHALALVRERLA